MRNYGIVRIIISISTTTTCCMIIVQTAILGIGLEKYAIRSIAGRPEEEWILDNNNNDSNKNNNSYRCPMLLAGVDRSKDQSYFLSGVKSEASITSSFHWVIYLKVRTNNINNSFIGTRYFKKSEHPTAVQT